METLSLLDVHVLGIPIVDAGTEYSLAQMGRL
jgi:hypothetical protein